MASHSGASMSANLVNLARSRGFVALTLTEVTIPSPSFATMVLGWIAADKFGNPEGSNPATNGLSSTNAWCRFSGTSPAKI